MNEGSAESGHILLRLLEEPEPDDVPHPICKHEHAEESHQPEAEWELMNEQDREPEYSEDQLEGQEESEGHLQWWEFLMKPR